MLEITLNNQFYFLVFNPLKQDDSFQLINTDGESVGSWSLLQSSPEDEDSFNYYVCGVNLETKNPLSPPLIQITNNSYDEAVMLQLKEKKKPSLNC